MPRPSALSQSGLPTPDLVDQVAAAIARREFRRITEADLRRAVRTVALGRDVPDGNTLSHGDLQRVVLAMQILADPDDVSRVMEWSDPTVSQRRSLVAAVERLGFDEAYLRHISSEVYRQPLWRSLAVQDLAAFSRLVRLRTDHRRSDR